MVLVFSYREEHVLLVLVDRSRVRDGVCVFDDRHRFTYDDNKEHQVKYAGIDQVILILQPFIFYTAYSCGISHLVFK